MQEVVLTEVLDGKMSKAELEDWAKAFLAPTRNAKGAIHSELAFGLLSKVGAEILFPRKKPFDNIEAASECLNWHPTTQFGKKVQAAIEGHQIVALPFMEVTREQEVIDKQPTFAGKEAGQHPGLRYPRAPHGADPEPYRYPLWMMVHEYYFGGCGEKARAKMRKEFKDFHLLEIPDNLDRRNSAGYFVLFADQMTESEFKKLSKLWLEHDKLNGAMSKARLSFQKKLNEFQNSVDPFAGWNENPMELTELGKERAALLKVKKKFETSFKACEKVEEAIRTRLWKVRKQEPPTPEKRWLVAAKAQGYSRRR